jgi:hypothetical protein
LLFDKPLLLLSFDCLPFDLVAIFRILFAAIATLMVNFLPPQLIFMRRRAVYYLWGEDWERRALSV